MIEYLNVRITPHMYSKPGYVIQEMDISVKDLGKEEYTDRQLVPLDEFYALFEILMDNAKKRLIFHIREMQKERILENDAKKS